MTLFWIGIVIFAVGMIARIVLRLVYARERMAPGVTPLRAGELQSRFRSRMLIGLGIETVGCIITVVAAFFLK